MMARRTGLATAGRQIGELADRLSARLADEEAAAFAAIDRAYDPDVAAKQINGHLQAGRTITQMGNMRSLVPDLAAELDSAGRLARRHAETLADRAAAMAAESVVKELRLCEQALGRRYRGLADEVADNLTDLDTAPHLADYDRAMTAAVDAFRSDVRTQLRKATEQDILDRLFSPTPVTGVRGFGGRGVWWRAVSGAHAAARAVSISACNTTRMAGMDAFNTLGDGYA